MAESYALRRVGALLPFLRARSVRRILQVGGGEVVSLLVSEGFEVTVLEPSRESLAGVRKTLEDKGLRARLIEGPLNELPVPRKPFDFVLAFNTLYRSDRDGLKRSIDSLLAQLREDGFFYITLISTRHADYGNGVEVEPASLSLNGVITHYCDAADVVALLGDAKIIDLRDEEQARPGSFHWHVMGCRKGLSPSGNEG
jgi:tellurite methyltransferase